MTKQEAQYSIKLSLGINIMKNIIVIWGVGGLDWPLGKK